MEHLKKILGDSFKEEMTLEEIDAALAGVNFLDPADLQKQIDKNDKLASENADWKRKYQERLTAEEQKEEEYQELKRRFAVADHKTKFVGIGYDQELAEKAAEALVSGNADDVLRYQEQYIKQREKQIMEGKLKGSPPPAAGGPAPVTKSEFIKMSTEDQMKFIQENPGWKDLLK